MPFVFSYWPKFETTGFDQICVEDGSRKRLFNRKKWLALTSFDRVELFL